MEEALRRAVVSAWVQTAQQLVAAAGRAMAARVGQAKTTLDRLALPLEMNIVLPLLGVAVGQDHSLVTQSQEVTGVAW